MPSGRVRKDSKRISRFCRLHSSVGAVDEEDEADEGRADREDDAGERSRGSEK